MSSDEREHLRAAPGFRAIVEWPLREKTYLLGISEDTFSLYEGDDRAFHFDLEGRLRRVFSEGRNYLRGLDGTVLRKIRSRGVPPGALEGPLGPEEVRAIYERAESAVRRSLEAMGRPGSPGSDRNPGAEEALSLLERALEFDATRLAAEAVRFREAYAPLGVLPPDRYRALILQATEGCSYGKCAFCSLYRGIRYRRKDPAEFRDHLERVKAFLGEALRLKSGVFLGEANALEVPFDSLKEMFELIRREFPDQVKGSPGNRGGISVFTDVFSGRLNTPYELECLRELGLERVYLGVESGCDEVARRLRKPVSREAALRRAASFREAGLPVGVIFLVGAGGSARSREHVEGTVSLVASMELGERDVVYLSRLHGDLGACALQGGDTWEPLEPSRLEAEEKELRARLRLLGVRISRYDLKSFVYY